MYVSQEIAPFLPENDLSKTSRFLPKAMNESRIDVHLFMPRFNCINERRHQLHEVIRLSGMNLIVNDIDQPLIIKLPLFPSSHASYLSIMKSISENIQQKTKELFIKTAMKGRSSFVGSYDHKKLGWFQM